MFCAPTELFWSINPPMKKATINNVADLAGVSIKTVSRVINLDPNVRAATQERVALAIAELNYSPNPAARILARRRVVNRSLGLPTIDGSAV